MKWRIIKISNLILALLLVAFTIGYTYAWFADYYSIDIKLYVSPDGGYFAGGSGTVSDPYIITRPTHLYNLAWLQNSGKFSSTEATYFQIGNDDNNINMNGYVIPPIGNDDNPFIGVFDGNGCTISNLIVSTDKNKLTNFPVESASGYEFSNYVGLFGKTGTYTDGTSNETCGADIKNFILDDPILEVATDSNTLYSTATNESYCGLAIGYVAYKASSIGVIGGTLAVKKEGYSTYNSILGAYDEDKITSHITGDTGYGSSLDLVKFYKDFGGDDNIQQNYSFPFKTTTGYSSANYVTPSDSTISIEYTSGKTNNVYTATTVAAASNNIGYYTGADLKAYTSSISYEFAIPSGWNETTDTNTHDSSVTCSTSPTEEVTNYLNRYGGYLMRLTGNMEVDNDISKSDFINRSRLSYVYNGVINGKTQNLLVPQRCIWVAPTTAGTLKFVFVNRGNDGDGCQIVRLTRSTARDYDTYFSASTTILDCPNTFADGKSSEYWYAYYFEIEVTEDDITNGYEYAITGTYKSYIAYIDIGQNGADLKNEMSNIDFIYNYDTDSTVVIENDSTSANYGCFVLVSGGALYTETGTMIAFDAVDTTGAIIILAFSRPDGGTDTSNCTISVSYYVDGYGTPTSSVSGKESLTSYDTYKEENNTYVFSNSE